MSMWMYIAIALAVANIGYLGIGGLIHWWYYSKNRDKAAEWKIQPKKFLSDKLNREAILLGTFNLNYITAIFGVLAWGIFEKGWSQLYWDIHQYSIGYTLLSIFLTWLVIEAGAYYFHALCHIGWMYKKVHSMHHRYTAPTFYTISAMHPIEWFLHTCYIAAPAFLFPLHGGIYLATLVTVYVLGFWDHCGIKLFRIPLHGSNKFHDDHHKYFHVNFGFTCSIFDRIHDTVRREGHHYNEETFNGGKGIVRDPAALGDRAIGRWVEY